MQSSGKTTSSAPSSRARPIHSATFAALASIAPTVGLIWARAMRIGLRRLLPAASSSRPGRYFLLPLGFSGHAEPPAPPGRNLGGAADSPRRTFRCPRCGQAVHPAAAAADGRAEPPDRRPGSQPQRLLGAGGEELAG